MWLWLDRALPGVRPPRRRRRQEQRWSSWRRCLPMAATPSSTVAYMHSWDDKFHYRQKLNLGDDSVAPPHAGHHQGRRQLQYTGAGQGHGGRRHRRPELDDRRRRRRDPPDSGPRVAAIRPTGPIAAGSGSVYVTLSRRIAEKKGAKSVWARR